LAVVIVGRFGDYLPLFVPLKLIPKAKLIVHRILVQGHRNGGRIVPGFGYPSGAIGKHHRRLAFTPPEFEPTGQGDGSKNVAERPDVPQFGRRILKDCKAFQLALAIPGYRDGKKGSGLPIRYQEPLDLTPLIDGIDEGTPYPEEALRTPRVWQF